MKRIFAAALFLLAIAACRNNNNNTTSGDSSNAVEDNSNPAPPTIGYSVLKVYPHDTSSFTQGLEWYNNTLYESTGSGNEANGDKAESRLMKVQLETGKPIKKTVLTDPDDFGEGMTIFNNKIYQLTWQTHKVYVYDLNSFKKLQSFDWPYEGWGITHNSKSLIISTGSNNLYFVDPVTFKIQNSVGVMDNYGPVANLNELEYIKGAVFANIWQTNYIVKINPETGRVEGKLDLGGIEQNNSVPVTIRQDVLNGIAYDSAKNSLYVTGKLWPALFEIKLN